MTVVNISICKTSGGTYRYSDRRRKLTFPTTALSFDTTSAANPDEYRYTQKPQTGQAVRQVGLAIPRYAMLDTVKTLDFLPR